MLCVFLGQTTRCCANLFQDFPFNRASICTLSLISKLNAGSILKAKVASLKLDATLVTINKRINTNYLCSVDISGDVLYNVGIVMYIFF